MFENCHQVHFLTHYLNTTVFSYLSQSQFPTLISRAISNYYSPVATVIFFDSCGFPLAPENWSRTNSQMHRRVISKRRVFAIRHFE